MGGTQCPRDVALAASWSETPCSPPLADGVLHQHQCGVGAPQAPAAGRRVSWIPRENSTQRPLSPPPAAPTVPSRDRGTRREATHPCAEHLQSQRARSTRRLATPAPFVATKCAQPPRPPQHLQPPTFLAGAQRESHDSESTWPGRPGLDKRM